MKLLRGAERGKSKRWVLSRSVLRGAAAWAMAGVLSPAGLWAAEETEHHAETVAPSLFWALPFVMLLLSIAILPLLPRVAHWWERNKSKLLVSIVLSLITLAYYTVRGRGLHGSDQGLATIAAVLDHALLIDFIPFIVLLFSLYTISGGIHVSGNIPAHPITNVTILLIGTALASFIGTTGASMLLIRPLLQTNRERKYVKHTVIFFIFLVSNIGGSLLPVGDPPLFLGYIRGVPFLWTLALAPMWLLCIFIVITLYWAIDTYYYRHEAKANIKLDEFQRTPIRITGKFNFILLLGVVLAVALLVPGQTFPGTQWVVPNLFLREFVQLALAALSVRLTQTKIREANMFSYYAIAEVACLFVGIFITMQVPIEYLRIRGPELGMTSPTQFFWATGILSSFLDNAPTYVVFFATAGALPAEGAAIVEGLETVTGSISVSLLIAISCGAVFMGANTYIGNGPNFMVKSIAEHSGVRMPSFFGYMAYSVMILFPVFIIITFVFFR